MAGAIKGITIEFQGDTTKLDKALRQVGKEAKNTQNELKQINTSLKFNPRSVEMWRQKQAVLNKAIEETKNRLKLMKDGLAEMSKQGLNSKNSEEFRKLERDIEQAERQLKGFERELRAIGNANLQALGQQFKDIGSKASDVGKKMSMYVTGPLVGVGAVAAKGFAEVDKTMQLTNATMGNTEDQAQLLNKAMKDAASASVYGMTDAATATLNFARAGLTAEQAAAALAPAMNLAAGEGGNLDVVSGGLVATINGFHGSFDEAARYADVFANACNNSALDVDSLSNAMSVAAPIFSAAGYAVEDAALYMGVMANNGIEADVAANSLKTGMARLVSPSKDAAGWMEKLGISIVNSDGTMKDSITVQKELNNAFKDLSESEQIAAASAIFGKNQMSPWLALINTAPGDVEALSSAIYEEGTASEMAANMMGGFGGALEQLKSGIDVAKVSLGEALAPIILKVAEGIQSLVDWFNNLSPTMQRVIAVIGVVVAAIGPLLVVFGTMLSLVGSILTNWGLIAGAAGKLASAFSAVGKAIGLIASPLGVVVVAIGVLAAAFKTLWENNEEFRAHMTAIWNYVKQTVVTFVGEATAKIQELIAIFTGGSGSIREAWEAFCNFLAPAFESAFAVIAVVVKNVLDTILGILDVFIAVFKGDWSAAWEATKALFSTVWTGIVQIFRMVWTLILNIVKAQLQILRTIITTVFNVIKSFVQAVWSNIKTLISNAIEQAKTKVQNTVNSIRNAVTSSFNSLKTTVSNIWTGIKTAITSPIESAANTVKKIIDKIKGFFPISVGKIMSNLKLPHFNISGKFSLNPPSVPKFSVDWYAKGGIFDSPSVIGVGEAGKEAVVPLDKFWQTLEANNQRTDAILTTQTRILISMLEELQKDKDFRIDGRVAGRIINDLVRV